MSGVSHLIFFGAGRRWKKQLKMLWHATYAFFVTRPTGRGKIPRGDFSAGKIPYFNLVRNFPLIFRGEVQILSM